MSDVTNLDDLVPQHVYDRIELEFEYTDGPVFSADGSLIAHRTDPELAEFLRSLAAERRLRARRYHTVDTSVDKLERAAMLAAPASVNDGERTGVEASAAGADSPSPASHSERCPGSWMPCPPNHETVIVDGLPLRRSVDVYCPAGCGRKIHPRADGKVPAHKPTRAAPAPADPEED